jgi:large subunit ribosomal protein L3
MKAKKLGIIGKKLGMTQFFLTDSLVGVTVVDFSDMSLLGKRTVEKDGYLAAILGCGFDKKEKARFIQEVRVPDASIYDEEKYLDVLEGLKKVDVFGMMKGRGFTGVMKRHGFHGGPAAHGAKHWHRRPGSIGGHTYPAKVWKGQKMPGHYGNSQICTLNQKLIKVDKEKKLLFIQGSIPGSKNSYVWIRDSIRG